MMDVISNSIAALLFKLTVLKCKGPLDIENREQRSHAKGNLPHSLYYPHENKKKERRARE